MRDSSFAKAFWRTPVLVAAFLVVSPGQTEDTVGTPSSPTSASALSEIRSLEMTTLNASGPRAGVLAYCTDLVGIFGASNTANTLVADGRFGSVTVIDGDVVLPTAADLLDQFDCVIAMTDNRCGLPIPQAIADSAANAMAGFANAGGGVVISTFGFSHRPSGGIGFGAAIFGPGLSPLQQQIPFFNAAAGGIDVTNLGGPRCAQKLDGVTSPVSSSFANHVAVSGGGELCANYLNGRNLLAINPVGNVVGLNTFPASQGDNGQASYRQLVANALFSTCAQSVPVDVKPQSCPNPLNRRDKGVVSVAIAGTATFDATQVDPATVKLNGVAPLRWSLEDAATPFSPFIGKSDCDADCTAAGADGITDLVLKFDATALNAATPGADRQCVVVKLEGELLNGRKIKGEDVVRIINN